MVYSFISYSNLIYEMTVHAQDCTGITAVRIGLSIYSSLTKQSCLHELHIQDKSIFSN